MKLLRIIFIIISIGLMSIHTKNHKKSRKSQQDKPLYPVQTSTSYIPQEYEPKNIAETFYGGNPNTLPMDRHFLWKDFKKNQYQRPFMHGVVGPTWKVPVPEDAKRYTHISSPVPHGDYNKRVIAYDLPAVTHSHTSWDLPKRKDVVQIDIPFSATHSREMYVDPRLPPKGLVAQVTGSQYHNTGSVDSKVNMANNMVPTAANPQTVNSEFSFLENSKKNKIRKNLKKSRKHHKSHNKLTLTGKPGIDGKEVKETKKLSLKHASEAEDRSRRLLGALTPHPEGMDGSMTLGIDMLNKEDINFGLHQNNKELANSLEFWKGHPQGIRSMHTKPFLPPPQRIN